MRIVPAMNVHRNFVKNSMNNQTKFESNNNVVHNGKKAHKYTGVASADLAYASMFDSAIARDLRLMGLI